MFEIRRGDRGPVVAALQLLLNRDRGSQDLVVDGIFGAWTTEAVQQAQYAARLETSGTVDAPTWNALTTPLRLATIACNDIYDPAHDEVTPPGFRGRGWIASGGMSNGVEHVVRQIEARAAGQGSIILLRFYGHGAPGLMSLTAGTGSLRNSDGRSICHDETGQEGFVLPNPMHDRPNVCRTPTRDVANEVRNGRTIERFAVLRGSHVADRTTLSTGTLPHVQQTLARLRPLFVKCGSVELHGCRVGAGRVGGNFLATLARILGVPVSAGVESQQFGATTGQRFEGPVRTAFPRGTQLREWARHLPQLGDTDSSASRHDRPHQG